MNRRTWAAMLLVGSLSTAAAAGTIGGCGSETDVGANGEDGGGDETGNTSSSSGFVPTDSGGDGTVGPTGQNACTPPTALTIAPADKVATVSPGGAFTQAYTVTASYAGKPDQDVTAQSFFSVSDPGVGTFAGPTFTWGGTQGGVVTVSAKSCGVVGSTHLTLKVAASFGAGGGVDAGADGSAGGDAGLGGVFNGAPPTAVTACNPKVVYPPEGVLIPPNMNVIEVHFTDGTPANNLFEVSFSNAVTDVKVYTTCTGTKPADGLPSSALVPTNPGGCVFELSQAEWDFIAKTNRDGDPLAIDVKGLGCDASGGVGTSGPTGSNTTKHVSFAKDDMLGTLYYWASMRIDANGNVGTNFNSGGVFRYDFGVRGQSAEPVLTPASQANAAQHNCIGCHDISRDGRKMVFDYDDNDSDDEYGDVFTNIYDVADASAVKPIIKNAANSFPPGFHTWNRSTVQFLLSDGPGNSAPPDGGSFARIAPDGGTLGYTKPGTLRGTTPDWAPDDSRVVFAVPPNVFANGPNPGYWMNKQGPRDDLMFAGASLYVAPWNAATNSLGAPVALLTSNGADNFYYPSFSPEGSLIVYNHAATGSNFHNPKATIEVIDASQATPTRTALAKLNDTGDLTNSWARWAPFQQTYKGQKLLWVTTSSTRNYGLRIDNGGTVNCYPKESPNFVTPDFTSNPASGCSRTQIWMAAVKLDPAGVQAGVDPSFPAFYLPFQDITTNNHLAQWAQKSFKGVCKVNADCSTQPGKCCDNGGCTTCPSPPIATCSSDPNCPTGQCCTGGTCGACAGGDGGTTGDGGTGIQCNTCLDCNSQACVNGQCGSCTNSSQCCAPLVCVGGTCINQVN